MSRNKELSLPLGISLFGLVIAIVAGVTVLTLQQANGRGTMEFASPSLIEMIEVDSIEDLGRPGAPFPETGSPPTYRPTRQIAERVDALYLPTSCGMALFPS